VRTTTFVSPDRYPYVPFLDGSTEVSSPRFDAELQLHAVEHVLVYYSSTSYSICESCTCICIDNGTIFEGGHVCGPLLRLPYQHCEIDTHCYHSAGRRQHPMSDRACVWMQISLYMAYLV
jgi:hypothetical protein